MKTGSFAAVAVLGVAVSGCATIIEGSTQPVSVSTTPEEGAQCTLVNSQGTWYLTTPASTTVHKTKTDLNVTCAKPGYEAGHVLAVSHFGATTAGNIIAGGVVGIGVDAASGANFHYDSPIVVPLGPRTTELSAPAYPSPAAAVSAMDAPPRVDATQPHTQLYPESAQASGEQGTVLVDVYVRPNGQIGKYALAQSSGYGDLDNAALQSVLNWRFIPARRNGDTVPDWTIVKIVYQLPPAPAQPSSPPG
jgi:TonB family protein